MASFSSADFGRTEASVRVSLPSKLIHENVVGTNRDDEFSAQRKHPVYVVDLPSLTLSVTIGGLDPGQSTGRHRHSYETIMYVLEGAGASHIEDRVVDWQAGDAIYIPVWAWHHHVNASTSKACRYIAVENAPLLQNLGGLAIREEAASDQPGTV
jgi:quercetin dioxygenase-like cupin family protein